MKKNFGDNRTNYDLFGVECGIGWKSLYAPIIEYAQKVKATITCVKEKFGWMRIYYCGGDEKLEKMVRKAEQLSKIICEDCGTQKTVGLKKIGGWYRTLCNNCERIMSS